MMRHFMNMRVNPSILITCRLLGIVIIQIAISILLLKCYVYFFKSYFSFWFSLLFPLSFGLITNFMNFRMINVNRILLYAATIAIALFIEYIAFLSCITIFGE